MRRQASGLVIAGLFLVSFDGLQPSLGAKECQRQHQPGQPCGGQHRREVTPKVKQEVDSLIVEMRAVTRGAEAQQPPTFRELAQAMRPLLERIQKRWPNLYRDAEVTNTLAQEGIAWYKLLYEAQYRDLQLPVWQAWKRQELEGRQSLTDAQLVFAQAAEYAEKADSIFAQDVQGVSEKVQEDHQWHEARKGTAGNCQQVLAPKHFTLSVLGRIQHVVRPKIVAQREAARIYLRDLAMVLQPAGKRAELTPQEWIEPWAERFGILVHEKQEEEKIQGSSPRRNRRSAQEEEQPSLVAARQTFRDFYAEWPQHWEAVSRDRLASWTLYQAACSALNLLAPEQARSLEDLKQEEGERFRKQALPYGHTPVSDLLIGKVGEALWEAR